jgi:hypothetical protein
MTVGCWLIIFIQEYRSQVQYSESLKLLWLCVNSLVGIHGTVDATFDSSVSATQLLNIWPLVNMYSTKVTFIYSSPVARSYVDAVKQKMTSKVQAIIQRIQFKKPPNDACRGKYLPTFGTAADTLVLCCWGIHGLVFMNMWNTMETVGCTSRQKMLSLKGGKKTYKRRSWLVNNQPTASQGSLTVSPGSYVTLRPCSVSTSTIQRMLSTRGQRHQFAICSPFYIAWSICDHTST